MPEAHGRRGAAPVSGFSLLPAGRTWRRWPAKGRAGGLWAGANLILRAVSLGEGDLVVLLRVLVVEASAGFGLLGRRRPWARGDQWIFELLGAASLADRRGRAPRARGTAVTWRESVSIIRRGRRGGAGEYTTSASAPEVVALVGALGACKSTILNLLLALLHPDEGSDRDRRHTCARSTRRGCVPDRRRLQEPVLFRARSPTTSLRIDRVGATPSAGPPVACAASSSRASRRVRDTIGTRGVSLGGQRQRLAIARQSCRPRVLVLDEATTRSTPRRAFVHQALRALDTARRPHHRHRLSTVINLDRRRLAWRIVDGGPTRAVKTSPVYRQLVETRFATTPDARREHAPPGNRLTRVDGGRSDTRSDRGDSGRAFAPGRCHVSSCTAPGRPRAPDAARATLRAGRPIGRGLVSLGHRDGSTPVAWSIWRRTAYDRIVLRWSRLFRLPARPRMIRWSPSSGSRGLAMSATWRTTLI